MFEGSMFSHITALKKWENKLKLYCNTEDMFYNISKVDDGKPIILPNFYDNG